MARIRIDENRNEVFEGKRRVHVPKKEYEILVALNNAQSTMNRKTLLDLVWRAERGNKVNVRTVDQHISRLRRRFSDAAKVIETVSGYGYRIA